MAVKFLLLFLILVAFRLPISIFAFFFHMIRPLFFVAVGFIGGIYMSQDDIVSPLESAGLEEESSFITQEGLLNEGVNIVEAAAEWGQAELESIIESNKEAFEVDFSTLGQSAGSLLRVRRPEGMRHGALKPTKH